MISVHPCRDVLEGLAADWGAASAPLRGVLLLQIYALLAEPTEALVAHVRHERASVGLGPDQRWQRGALGVLHGEIAIPPEARL